MHERHRTFLHYIVEKKIGEGGMGAVYKVHDQRLNRKAALKVILGGGNFSEKQLQRFVNEARATASLQHPNIVKVYEVGSTPQHYFTMEFVDGVSLRDLLKQKNLTSREIATIMLKCSEAVHYAHKNKIIHRDIKPENIMMEHGIEPKIMDFGLAKDTGNDEQLSKTGDVVGTISYMSPEQANGKKTDTRSDVYSLGATLYEMLTKRPPFQGDDTMGVLCQIFTEEPIEPRLLNPDIPKELEAICLKCLKKNPNKRYQSAAQLASDINNFMKNRPVRAQPITNWIRFKKAIVRNKVAVAFAMVITVSLLAITALSLQAKKYAEQQKQKAEQQKQKAEEALQEKENALLEKKIALYKQNIQLTDICNYILVNPTSIPTHSLVLSSRFASQEISNILKRTREEIPEVTDFWEYRWQKNRNHYESMHPISRKNANMGLHSLSLSRNNLLTLQLDDKVAAYNLENPQLPPVYFNSGFFACSKISHNGKYVAVGNRFGTVMIYDVKTKKRFDIKLQTPGNTNIAQRITSLAFSRDDAYLLITKRAIFAKKIKPVEYFSSLILFDVSTKKIKTKMAIPKRYRIIQDRNDGLIGASFYSCDISNNNEAFIGATDDGYVYEFSRNKVAFFGPHESAINKCRFHPKNQRIIVSSDRDQIFFWDRELYKKENRQQSHVGAISAKNILNFSISPDGSKIAIVTQSGNIYIHTIQIHREGNTLQIKTQYFTTLIGHEVLKDSVFLNNDQLLSVGDGCKFWEVRKHENPFRRRLTAPSNFCTFHPHKDIVVVSPHAVTTFYDTKTGKKIREFVGHVSGVTHAAFDKKGTLYTSGFDGSIVIWDMDFRNKKTYNYGQKDINAFAIVNDDTKIIAACNNSYIYTLDLINGKKEIYHIKKLITSSPHFSVEYKNIMRFSESFDFASWNKDDLVAIGGEKTWLYIINTKSNELVYAFDVGKAGVLNCVLWQDPKTKSNYVYLSKKRDIVKYKVTANKLEPVIVLKGHSSDIYHIAIDPTSTRLISCDQSGSILFWPVDEVDNPLVNLSESQKWSADKIGNPFIKLDALQKLAVISPYFKLKATGVLSFCSFDSTGNKVGCCGGDTGYYTQLSNNFFQVWDANYSKMDE